MTNGVANEEGRPPTPPPPWRLEEHPEAPGEWYYLNTATGETTWELPEEEGTDGAEGEREAKPPMPPRPWKTMEHPDAPGEWYYLNEDTGETCWDLPDNMDSSADVEQEIPVENQPDNCLDNMADTTSTPAIAGIVGDAPICEEAACEEAMVDDGKNTVDDNDGTGPPAATPETTTEAEVTGLINDTASETVTVNAQESVSHAQD